MDLEPAGGWGVLGLKPCKRGHTEGRNKDRSCVACKKAYHQTPQWKAYLKAYMKAHRTDYDNTPLGIIAMARSRTNWNLTRFLIRHQEEIAQCEAK